MSENPYDPPQAPLDETTAWTRANIIATTRASLAEIGLSLAVLCLLVLPFITIVPGGEQGVYRIPALLGCAGLLHPYRLPLILGGLSLAALGLLLLFSR